MGPRSFDYTRELNIISDADDSVVLVNVYQKHHFKEDDLVGRLTDTVDGLLGKMKDGGTKILCITYSTDASAAIIVLEDTLHAGKDASDESDLSGMTISFALAAQPLGLGDVNADERQARDAVNRATAPLSSTPAAVGLLGSAVDTGTNLVTGAQTFETTWGVLLHRMELFNGIVDGIAQVFGVQCFSSLTG